EHRVDHKVCVHLKGDTCLQEGAELRQCCFQAVRSDWQVGKRENSVFIRHAHTRQPGAGLRDRNFRSGQDSAGRVADTAANLSRTYLREGDAARYQAKQYSSKQGGNDWLHRSLLRLNPRSRSNRVNLGVNIREESKSV